MLRKSLHYFFMPDELGTWRSLGFIYLSFKIIGKIKIFMDIPFKILYFLL